MILLESLKTKLSMTDNGNYYILCNEEYARHIEPKNYYSAFRKLQSYLPADSHKCEMLYMVSSIGFQ